MDDVVAKATVEIAPDLSDFAAKLKAELEQAMSGQGGDAIKVPLDADTTDFDTKTDEVDAKADKLGAKAVTVDIKARDDDAIEKMAEAGKAEDALSEKADNLKEKMDVLSESSSAAGASAGSAGESFGGILLPAILTLVPAIAPLAAVAGGASIALLGMGTAAIAGPGAFALAAMPVYKQVSTALTTITADQAAVNTATSTASKNTAILKLKDDIAQLSPGVADLVVQIQNVKQGFMNWDAQFQPQIMMVFASALQLINPLLNDLTPLVKAGASSLVTLFGGLKTAIESSGFKTFISWLSTEGTRALMSFVSFFGGFAAGLGKMFEGMTPFMHQIEDGLDDMGKHFEAFSTSNTFHTFVEYVLKYGPVVGQFFQQMFRLIETTLVQLAPVGLIVVKALSGAFKIISDLNQILPTGSVGFLIFAAGAVLAGVKIMGAFNSVVTTLKEFNKMIAPVVSGLFSMAFGEDAVAVSGDGAATATGLFAAALDSIGIGEILLLIGLIIAAVIALGTAIYEAATHWKTTWSTIKDVARDAVDFLMSKFVLLVPGFGILIFAIVQLATHWRQVFGDIKNWSEDAWKFIENDVIHPMVSIFNSDVAPVLRDMAQWFRDTWKIVQDVVKIAVDIVIVWLKVLAAFILVPLITAFLVLRFAVVQAWQIITQIIQWAMDVIRPLFTWLVNFLGPVIGGAMNTLGFVFSNAWQIIAQAVQWASDVIRPIVDWLINNVGPPIMTAMGLLETAWSDVWSFLGTVVNGAWTDVIEPVINFIIGKINDLINAVNSVTGLLPGIGSALHIADIPTVGGSGPTPTAIGSGQTINHSGRGHATGGTIPRNEWSLVGENGPEPFFSGPNGGSMFSNQKFLGILGSALSSVGTQVNSTNVQATFSPNIFVDGTGLDQGALTSAINTALSQHDSDLIDLLQAHGVGNG